LDSGSSRSKLSRRDLLTRGSVGAAALWTAPVITSLGARAVAGTPAPCACTGFAAGIDGAFTAPEPFPPSGSTSGGTSDGEKDCDQGFSQSFGEIGSIFAQGTCGEFVAETCTARATFGEGAFNIEIFGLGISGDTITSEITTGGCSCGVLASASLISVQVGDEDPITLSPPPNTPVNLSGPGGTLSGFLNHQFCDGNESVVQAVFLNAVGAGQFAGASGLFVLSESRVLTPTCECPFGA
jgi:hypothetical protein